MKCWKLLSLFKMLCYCCGEAEQENYQPWFWCLHTLFLSLLHPHSHPPLDRMVTNMSSSTTRTQKEKQKEFHHQTHRTKQWKQEDRLATIKSYTSLNTELNNKKQDDNLHHSIITTHKPAVKNHICI
jgi:hypothetical protein